MCSFHRNEKNEMKKMPRESFMNVNNNNDNFDSNENIRGLEHTGLLCILTFIHKLMRLRKRNKANTDHMKLTDDLRATTKLSSFGFWILL